MPYCLWCGRISDTSMCQTCRDDDRNSPKLRTHEALQEGISKLERVLDRKNADQCAKRRRKAAKLKTEGGSSDG